MKQKLEKLEEQFSTESEVSKNNSLNCVYGRMYSTMLLNHIFFYSFIYFHTVHTCVHFKILQLPSIINKSKT
jgi:hypothetical protein